jgi:hypothetical protein
MKAHPVSAATLSGLVLLMASSDSLGGCEAKESAPLRGDQSLSMYLSNALTPFVTKELAERLALLVLEEKYASIFTANLPATTKDECDAWLVTVTNKDWSGESARAGSIKPKQLSIRIRKRDAAILAIT